MNQYLGFSIAGEAPKFGLVDIDGLHPFLSFWAMGAATYANGYQDQCQEDE